MPPTSTTTAKRRTSHAEENGSPLKRSRKASEDSASGEASNPQAVEWPASPIALNAAREYIKRCAGSPSTKTLIIPDKDADGLCGGSIIYRTLLLLGHSPDLIDIHIVTKGSNVHEHSERTAIAAYGAKFVIIVDQGSRGESVLPEGEGGETEVLIVDHHLSDEFPPGATILTACHHEPVATSALLSYILCRPLHKKVASTCDWLACMGTIGDLGTSFKWEKPFPDMKECFKLHTKKAMNDAVSLLNAPRRTATYDVMSAWDALRSSSSPQDILASKSPYVQRLLEARREVNLEVARCSHSAPQFSSDGKVALLRISSKAQVHPVVATRWAGTLKSKALEVVMVANEGYLPDKVNFSCRIARCAYTRNPESPVNIIELLKWYADRPSGVPGASEADSVPATDGLPTLRERLGDNFARGHKQASGGIVGVEDFDELCRVMEIGVKKDVGSSKKKPKVQKNTLDGYFSSPVKS